jgi:hypothetical protein
MFVKWPDICSFGKKISLIKHTFGHFNIFTLTTVLNYGITKFMYNVFFYTHQYLLSCSAQKEWGHSARPPELTQVLHNRMWSYDNIIGFKNVLLHYTVEFFYADAIKSISFTRCTVKNLAFEYGTLIYFFHL